MHPQACRLFIVVFLSILPGLVFSETMSDANLSPIEQAILGPALDNERDELEDEMSDFKAWPVLSLTFVYNF